MKYKNHIYKKNFSKAFYTRATLPVSVKTRNDFADYDYIDILSKKDLKWLKKFHSEYYQASFQHKKPLHQDRKVCYDSNNARNRDLYNIIKIKHKLTLLSCGDVEEKIRVSSGINYYNWDTKKKIKTKKEDIKLTYLLDIINK